MSDNIAEEKSTVHKRNLELREHSASVVREVFRVCELFRHALEMKSERRVTLRDKIDKQLKMIETNFDKLQTVIRNISIYQQNLQKISVSLTDIREKEAGLQDKYERLLEGTPPEEEEFKNRMTKVASAGVTIDRELLIKRRKDYLEGLDNVFKKFEDELLSLDKIRKEMEKAQTDLRIKQEEAIEAKEFLERHSKDMLGKVKDLEQALEVSVSEERILMREFEELMKGLDQVITLRPEVDDLLLEVVKTGQVEAATRRASAEPATSDEGEEPVPFQE